MNRIVLYTNYGKKVCNVLNILFFCKTRIIGGGGGSCDIIFYR